jgi:hypothetical protein
MLRQYLNDHSDGSRRRVNLEADQSLNSFSRSQRNVAYPSTGERHVSMTSSRRSSSSIGINVSEKLFLRKK